MFERLDTPEEAFNYKLGATLKMERTVLEILEDNIEEARDRRVEELLGSHLEESRAHVQNVESVFDLFGWEVDDSACPAIEALEKEGKANVKKANNGLVDTIILQGAVEVEHHEIAVYENLIEAAKAMGREDAVELLKRNLDSEQSALEKARAFLRELLAAAPKQPV